MEFFFKKASIVETATYLGLFFFLFVCVALHELGHCFVASKFGIKTKFIILSILGGIAQLEGNGWDENPKEEFLIAIGGPAVNFIIAAVLSILMIIVDLPLSSFIGNLVILNVFMAIFNLVPLLPLDGGRIFRAALASFISHRKATLIAGRIGQAGAIGFGILGILYNPILILIAIFIFVGATSELKHA